MDRTDAIALVAANARIDELLVSNTAYVEEARAARWTLIEREATLRTIEREWSIQRQLRHVALDELKGALARSEAALEEARREVSLLNQQAADLTKRWEEGRRAATPAAPAECDVNDWCLRVAGHDGDHIGLSSPRSAPAVPTVVGPTYERPVVDLVRAAQAFITSADSPVMFGWPRVWEHIGAIRAALRGIDAARYGASTTAAETLALSETGQPLHVVESWRETVTSLQRRLTEVTAERDKAVAERDTQDQRYIRLEMGRPVGLTFAELTRESVARCDEAFAQPVDEGVIHHPTDGSFNTRSHLMSWSALEWAASLAGEVGELCNLLKKLRRRGPNAVPTPEELQAIGKELADCQAYMPLVAARLGLDLAAETIAKFNEVSERVGSPRRLGPAVAP